jgi:uncharacterized protein (TIGR02246 family)
MSLRRALIPVLLCIAGCGTKAPPLADTAARQQQDVAAVHAFIDQVRDTFNGGDLDTFMQVFTEDAVQFNPGMPDVVGRDAIRRLYADALSQNDIKVQFHTREVVVAGDIAYEGGTYDIILKPRNDPKAASITVTNRHVHVLKRQADGAWKTWRMMTNSEAAVAAPQ